MDGLKVTGELARLTVDPGYTKRYLWILYQPATVIGGSIVYPPAGSRTSLSLQLAGQEVMNLPIYEQVNAASAWGIGSHPQGLLSSNFYPNSSTPGGLAVPQIFSSWVRFTNGAGGDAYQHFQVTPFILDIEIDTIICSTNIPTPHADNLTWLFLACLSSFEPKK